MFISTKQLNEIIETNKAQAKQIKMLSSLVSSLQNVVTELTEERQFLSDGEIDTLKEQLINNDEFEYALSEFVNDYLGDNIDDYVSNYIDSNHYVITDLVDDKVNEIFEEVTIKIER